MWCGIMRGGINLRPALQMRLSYHCSFTARVLAVAMVAILAATASAARFTVVALPDTQNYSESYPEIFASQTNWIAANVAPLGIVFVTHLGDVVNEGWKDAQWNNARAAMDVLRGVVPHGLCPGNHDLKSGAGAWESTKFVTNFGPERFGSYGWYGGASPSGFSSYQIVQAGGYDLLFLHLDYAAPYLEIDWATGVLRSHPGTPTIVTTHGYLNTTGRATSVIGPQSGRNSGEDIWNLLIRRFDQIFAVLCGHITTYHRQVSTNNAGRKVYEMLSDYQSQPNGGNGWLRLLNFDTTAGSLEIKTYSPYLDSYGTEDGSQFKLREDLAARFTPQSSHRPLTPQTVFSFDSGSAGWTLAGDATSAVAWRSDAEGRGYLRFTESASGSGGYFSAADDISGDFSRYDAIVFDYRVFGDDSTATPPRVRLYSGAQFYEWVNTERVTNNGQWERLVASLQDAEYWKPGGGATEPFSSFITHITRARVRADISDGPDLTALDNFALASYESPEQIAASSTFDSGLDGWGIYPSGAISFDAHGLAGVSVPEGGAAHFSAPSEFLGHKSTCLSGALCYDLRQSAVDSQADPRDVVLEGGGMRLLFDSPVSENPDTSTTRYQIPLSPGAGWTNDATGAPASLADMRTVLGSLTSLRIRAQYRSASSQAWLDNVLMTTGSDVGIEIGPPSVALTARGPVSYRVTYTGASSISLLPSDITLHCTGTANATVSVLGGSGFRTVVLSGVTGDGTLAISIKPGTATGVLPALGAGPSPPVIVDNTPPSQVTVTDDGAVTPSLTTLSATWTAATDGGGSGVAGYWFAVGSHANGVDVRPWTAQGNVHAHTDSALALADGQTYYISVAATDAAGNTGLSSSSDGITVAPGVARIALARDLPDSVPLALRGKIVSATALDAFWLEEADRSAAVKVISPMLVQTGDIVDVAGVLALDGGQRVLYGGLCVAVGTNGNIAPVTIRLGDLGGSGWNVRTPGVSGGRGLYNVGLLVRCWGEVVATDVSDPAERSFLLRDLAGAASRPVRVRCRYAQPPAVGSLVAVTGVVDIETSASETAPALVTRTPADVTRL